MINTAAMEVGRFDARTHTISTTIEPFGRFALGRKVGTVTLLSSTSTAVQLVGDGNGARLNVGSTVATNGVQCFIRNPYATPITIEFLEDMPIQVQPKQNVQDVEFAGVHRQTISYKMKAVGAVEKRGLLILPKKGNYFAKAVTTAPLDLSVLPNARPEYIDQMPAGMLAKTERALTSFGERNDEVLCRAGTYEVEDIGAWVTTTGWDFNARFVAQSSTAFEGALNPETALLFAHEGTEEISINLEIFDLGHWSPEWTSKHK